MLLRVALAVHQICYLPLVFASMVSIERYTQGWEQKAAERGERLLACVYLQLCAKCFAQPPASHPLIPYRLFHPAQQKCVTARRLYTRRVTGRARFYINRQSDARNALATLWLSELRRAAPHRLLIIIFSRPRWHLVLNDVNCDINHLCDGQREKWLYEDYMESDA